MSTSTGRSRGSIVDWAEDDVQLWLAELGYAQYQPQIKEHRISGDILSVLDHEGLREVGVHSVGQRLAILKEVYHLKVAHGVPIEPEHYVPPSEVVENNAFSMNVIMDMLSEQDRRIQILEEENQRLNEGLQVCLEELMQSRSLGASTRAAPPPLEKRPELSNSTSFKWGPLNGKAVASPTQPTSEQTLDSPHPSPHALEHDISLTPAKQPKAVHPLNLEHTERPTLHSRPSNQSINGSLPKASREAAENQFKSFKVSLDDPCWKVLPAALKKYKISDDWHQYAMFICYGTTERCLSYDEKPLLLFQRLKDANKNPVFMLRHIKDIRSPIAVAQQKQSQRETPPMSGKTPPSGSNRVSGAVTGVSSPTVNSALSYSRNTRLHQPPVLQPISAQALAIRNGAFGTPPLSSATSSAPQWPDTADADTSTRSRTVTGDDWHGDPQPTPISYAIAIYPYTKEQEDEFDVAVDDTFVISARAKGWWVVQRDLGGSGLVDEFAEKCWVPAGCLLETNIPPRDAIFEAGGSPHNSSPSAALIPNGAIYPTSIVSTSFPGVALMSYSPKGEYELNLVKDDVLRVFKRYNHWSYAIKEGQGERGWVPSWFIGKVATSGSGAAPPTPMPGPSTMSTMSSSSTLVGHTSMTSSDHDDERILLPNMNASSSGYGVGNGLGMGSPLGSPALPPV